MLPYISSSKSYEWDKKAGQDREAECAHCSSKADAPGVSRAQPQMQKSCTNSYNLHLT